MGPLSGASGSHFIMQEFVDSLHLLAFKREPDHAAQMIGAVIRFEKPRFVGADHKGVALIGHRFDYRCLAGEFSEICGDGCEYVLAATPATVKGAEAVNIQFGI